MANTQSIIEGNMESPCVQLIESNLFMESYVQYDGHIYSNFTWDQCGEA